MLLYSKFTYKSLSVEAISQTSSLKYIFLHILMYKDSHTKTYHRKKI